MISCVDDSFKSSSTSSVITQFTHYRSVPRCGSFFHSFTTLSSSKLSAASSALVPSLTSRIQGPSTEIFIMMSTFSGSKRQRSDRKIRFMVENDLSTSAVPIGTNRILLASTEKHGNNARFSGWLHSIIKPSLVDKSMGKRRRNCHLQYSSTQFRKF